MSLQTSIVAYQNEVSSSITNQTGDDSITPQTIGTELANLSNLLLLVPTGSGGGSGDITPDSIIMGNPQEAFSGGDIYFLGTSITNGYGASTASLNFTSLISSALGGLTNHNFGVPGADASDVNLSNIPTKSLTDRYLSIEYGTNEVINHGGTIISNSIFETNMQNILDNAVSLLVRSLIIELN